MMIFLLVGGKGCWEHLSLRSLWEHGSHHNLKTTHTYSVEKELQAKNHLPASNLEQGWVIDSGASAHMTPFKKDCYDIQNTNRRIYLVDGSSVICKSSGSINIPITKNILRRITLNLV